MHCRLERLLQCSLKGQHSATHYTSTLFTWNQRVFIDSWSLSKPKNAHGQAHSIFAGNTYILTENGSLVAETMSRSTQKRALSTEEGSLLTENFRKNGLFVWNKCMRASLHGSCHMTRLEKHMYSHEISVSSREKYVCFQKRCLFVWRMVSFHLWQMRTGVTNAHVWANKRVFSRGKCVSFRKRCRFARKMGLFSHETNACGWAHMCLVGGRR